MKSWAGIVFLVLIVCRPVLGDDTLDQRMVVDARNFLVSYLEFSNTKNINLLSLYTNDGVINVTVVTVDRQARTLELSGARWKQLLREAWYTGRPSAEPMQLHDIKVKPLGSETLEVTAHRYVLARCYWDNRYRLVIAKSSGQYHIVDETVLIDHRNQCEQEQTTIVNQEITINQTKEVR